MSLTFYRKSEINFIKVASRKITTNLFLGKLAAAIVAKIWHLFYFAAVANSFFLFYYISCRQLVHLLYALLTANRIIY